MIKHYKVYKKNKFTTCKFNYNKIKGFNFVPRNNVKYDGSFMLTTNSLGYATVEFYFVKSKVPSLQTKILFSVPRYFPVCGTNL